MDILHEKWHRKIETKPMVTGYNCLMYHPQELWDDRKLVQCFQCGTEIRITM